MERDDFEAYDVLEKQRRDRNRADAASDFDEAASLALRHGFRLRRHTDQHYKLTLPEHWSLELYPGNQRVYKPRGSKAPFLRVPSPWTLVDVVRSAVSEASR